MGVAGCGSAVTSTWVIAATSSIVTSAQALVAPCGPGRRSAPAASDPDVAAPAPVSSPLHAVTDRTTAATTAATTRRPPSHRRQCTDLPCAGAVAARLAPAGVRACTPRCGALSADDPVAAHRLWCDERNDLYAHHEQSPVGDRATFGGLTFFDYDPAWRVVADVQPAPAQRLVVQSDTGEDFVLDRVGVVDVPGGTLDVHWIDVYGGGVFVPLATRRVGSRPMAEAGTSSTPSREPISVATSSST